MKKIKKVGLIVIEVVLFILLAFFGIGIFNKETRIFSVVVFFGCGYALYQIISARREEKKIIERALQIDKENEEKAAKLKAQQEAREKLEKEVKEAFANDLASIPAVEIEPTQDTKRKKTPYNDVALSNVVKNSVREKLGNYTVIDVETTGLSASRCDIIEVAAIRFRNFSPVAKFSTFCHPRNGIPYDITELNGISEDMVEDSPLFTQIADQFQAFIGNDNIIGHNVKFDLKFLCYAGIDFGARRYYDTYALARKAIPKDDILNYKLETVADFFGYAFDAHRANADALITGMIFENLVDEIKGGAADE